MKLPISEFYKERNINNVLSAAPQRCASQFINLFVHVVVPFCKLQRFSVARGVYCVICINLKWNMLDVATFEERLCCI